MLEMISKQNFIKTRKTCLCDNPELIENYEQAISDKYEIWICHHRDEVKTLPSGIKVLRTRKELIENGRYYHCPPNELIFMTRSEHQKLHTKGKVMDDNTKTSIRNSISGVPKSKEHRKKLAKSHIGVSPANKNIPSSEFGEKYIKHYGYGKSVNEKQYKHEHYIFQRDSKCSWE